MVRGTQYRSDLLVLCGLALLMGCQGGPTTTSFTIQAFDDPQAPHQDPILRWNALALDTVAQDHTESLGPPEQGGPTRSSRALAMVHIAMYDAANAILGGYQPYLPVHLSAAIREQASVDAAVAQAAHDTIVVLYPRKRANCDASLALALKQVPSVKGREQGIQVGRLAAANILANRAQDGSANGEIPIYPGTAVPPLLGQHLPDPINPDQGLITPGWGKVATFSGLDVTTSGVRTPPPPALTDPEYAINYREVKRLGGDGVTTLTERTAEQKEIGLFWAYDDAPRLGTPPVHYNQVARRLALQQKNTVMQNARLFALVNISLGDTGVAAWDSKYYYNFWRPIIGIRHGYQDGNGQTEGDGQWTPLGAPATNSRNRNNFTPPFPAYPSGHAAFGASMFHTLRCFYGKDDISFRLTSDELHRQTFDSQGNRRPFAMRRYNSFSQGMNENARSRIYLGIHWQFDADSGLDMGVNVAKYVYANLLKPLP